MDNKQQTPTVKQEKSPKPKQEWFDPLVKIFQDLLDLNLHTYKKEKAPRL